MSKYEELVERCVTRAIENTPVYPNEAFDIVIDALAEVLRTLETWSYTDEFSLVQRGYDCAPGEFLSMLRASPLAPPK